MNETLYELRSAQLAKLPFDLPGYPSTSWAYDLSRWIKCALKVRAENLNRVVGVGTQE